MPKQLETITVILLENGKKIQINKSDFNEKLHKLVKESDIITEAIETYHKNKDVKNAVKLDVKPSTKKVAMVDTRGNTSANDVTKIDKRQRIALR